MFAGNTTVVKIEYIKPSGSVERGGTGSARFDIRRYISDTKDVIGVSQTILYRKADFDQDRYIVVSIPNVPKRAIEYYRAGDYKNLYDITNYFPWIYDYYDAKLKDHIAQSNQNPNPYVNLMSSLQIYSYIVACRVQKDVLSLLRNIEYKSTATNVSDTVYSFITNSYNTLNDYDKNNVCSIISAVYEMAVRQYAFKSLLDQTREPEAYVFLHFIYPFEEIVGHAIQYVEQIQNKRVTDDPYDFNFWNKDPSIYSTFLYNVTSRTLYQNSYNVSPNTSAGVCFSCESSRYKLLSNPFNFISLPTSYSSGNGVEKYDDMRTYLFMRIARHFDAVKSGNSLKLRRKTSYLFDNTYVEPLSVDWQNPTDTFILEIYYDSYWGLIRDYKNNLRTYYKKDGWVFSNPDNILTSDVNSILASSDYDIAFLSEMHLIGDVNSAVFDTFFVTKYLSTDSLDNWNVSDFYRYSTGYFTDTYGITTDFNNNGYYKALDDRIKNFIYYVKDYHEYYDDAAQYILEKEACNKKPAFIFLSKAYNLVYDEVFRDRKYCYYLHNNIHNTPVIGDVMELDYLLYFLVFLALGFQVFYYISETDNTTITSSSGLSIDYKYKYIDGSSPNQSLSDSEIGVREIYTTLRYGTSGRVYWYAVPAGVYTEDEKSIMIVYNNNVISSINIYEYLYNVLYSNRFFGDVYEFDTDKRFEDIYNLIRCGSLYGYVNLLPMTLNVRDGVYAEIEYNVKKNIVSSNMDFGGILMFIELPSQTFTGIRNLEYNKIIAAVTGEDNPIKTGIATLDVNILDRRLYAYGLPPFFVVDPRDFRLPNYRGKRDMDTYTDRHFALTHYQDPKNSKYVNAMGIPITGNEEDDFTYIVVSDDYDVNGQPIKKYHYLIRCLDANGNELYRAAKKVQDVLDHFFVRIPEFNELYHYEDLFNITTPPINFLNPNILNEFFMENVFYLVTQNIGKIKIPLINLEHMVDRSATRLTSFDFVTSVAYQDYPSIYEKLDAGLSTYSIEHDDVTNLYFREILLEKYIRGMLIAANQSLYNIIRSENNTSGVIAFPDWNLTYEIKTGKYADLELEENALVLSDLTQYYGPNITSLPIKLVKATLSIKIFTSGMIGEVYVRLY